MSYTHGGPGWTHRDAAPLLAPELEPGRGIEEVASAARIARPSLRQAPVLRASFNVVSTPSVGVAGFARAAPMPILAAFRLAARLHAGRARADGAPYDEHLRRVFDAAVRSGAQRDELIAALLRDGLVGGLVSEPDLLAEGVSRAAIDLMRIAATGTVGGDPTTACA